MLCVQKHFRILSKLIVWYFRCQSAYLDFCGFFESILGLEENCVSWQVLHVVVYSFNRESFLYHIVVHHVVFLIHNPTTRPSTDSAIAIVRSKPDLFNTLKVREDGLVTFLHSANYTFPRQPAWPTGQSTLPTTLSKL